MVVSNFSIIQLTALTDQFPRERTGLYFFDFSDPSNPKFPHVEAYFNRMKEFPSVKAAYAKLKTTP